VLSLQYTEMKSAILIAFLFIVTGANAQPGGIDRSFGNHRGWVQTDFWGRCDYVTSIALQSDGKIVAAGTSSKYSDQDSNDFAIVRYNSDGTIDETFGSHGKILYPFEIRQYTCGGMEIQLDGKIILAGSFHGVDYFADTAAQLLFVRFNGDGTLDSTFGISGKVETNFTSPINYSFFALQHDGKIIVACFNLTHNVSLIRLNQNGSLDSSFGNSGISLFDSNFGIGKIAIQDDDKIVASGVLIVDPNVTSGQHIAIRRFTSEGRIDMAFGSAGKINTEYINHDGRQSIRIRKDGRLLLGTTTWGNDPTSFSYYQILLQYLPNGTPDSTFGNNGITLEEFYNEPYLNSILIESDEKILAAGFVHVENGDYTHAIVTKYTANGGIDLTFGNQGLSYVSINSTSLELSIALLNQGEKNIIAIQTISSFGDSLSGDFLLERLNLNGSIDSTFNSYTGIFTSSTLGNNEATCISIFPDERILLGGHSEILIDTSDLIAIQYNPGGDIDPRFWSAGKLSLTDNIKYLTVNSSVIQSDENVFFAGSLYDPFKFTVEFVFLRYSSNNDFKIVSTTIADFGSGSSYCQSLLEQPDGKFVLSGYAFTDHNYDFALLRYNNEGSGLDSSFGTGGKVTTDIGVNQDYAYASALQSDGKIILCGTTYNNKQWQIALVRYNPDGSLDQSFGSSGIVLTALHDSDDEAKSIAIQADGKIIVAGYTRDNKKYNFALVRYNKNGNLDSTFGKYGIVETPIGSGDAEANGVVIESDGKIVAAGYSSNGKDDDFTLACYNPDGSLDKNFGTGGITTTDFGFGDDHCNAVALQSDGAIVAAGYAFNGTDKDYAVARYLPDLSLGVIDRKLPQSITTIYPNPIHSTATLQYELTKSQPITIKLYDILGNERAVFINDQIRSEGKNTEQIIFPNGIPPGSYYLRIETSEGVVSMKVIKSAP